MEDKDSSKSLPTFGDLRLQTRTGRAILLSGRGRDKRYGYRHGVVCKLGDIEQAEWQHMMRELIHRSGEDELYGQLLSWLKEHNCCNDTARELEWNALELHSMRIFEDEKWVDFIKFNQRFRPQALDGVAVAYARCECCNESFVTTQALLDSTFNGTTCCQICGRWSAFEVLSSGAYEKLIQEVNP